MKITLILVDYILYVKKNVNTVRTTVDVKNIIYCLVCLIFRNVYINNVCFAVSLTVSKIPMARTKNGTHCKL